MTAAPVYRPMTATPIYRPFAVAAFTATLGLGTPIGIWMASWLYVGAPAVPLPWILLHAHVQIVGFFGVLIPGVAHHLFARFTGRPIPRGPVTLWVFGFLVSGLVSRVIGTAAAPALVAAGASLEAAGLVGFTAWVWRSLDPAPLAALRRHLTLASGWFTVACLVEAVFRWSALAAGLALPDVGVLRASHAMALFGGVIGWVMGVLLRAGPMFVASWHVPLAAIRMAPLTLTAGVLAIALGEATVWTPAIAAGVARLGELIVLSTFAAVVVMSGALRRRGTALPMVARSAAEARIFRIALGSVGAALIGAALAAAAALGGQPDHLLTDVVRHLITIGVLTSVVTAMAFRLIPVLEGRPLPYPRLRAVAFWALLSAVVLRSAELLVGHGWSGRAAWVPLSGVLVWVALAAVAINLAVTIAGASRARSAGTAPGDPSGPPV